MKIFLLFTFCLFINKSFATNDYHAAILDISTLRKIETKYGIGRFFGNYIDQKITNFELQKTEFADVINTIDMDINDYVSKNTSAGIGMEYPERVFNSEYLKTYRSRFVLVGIINRMDRAYVSSETCGEVRFLYRLSYNVVNNGEQIASRLPMTINVVLNAKNKSDTNSCKELSNKWLSLDKSIEQNINTLLNHYDKSYLNRIEINLQLSRIPSAIRPDFGGYAKYLLRVFKFSDKKLIETYLENQIDREKIINDKNLQLDFNSWIKSNLENLDLGTALVPEKFLAKKAISVSPGGLTRSENRQVYGVVTTSELKNINYENLLQIKSAKGLYRRLNDMSCTGCHQTRAIGGFHFMGQDPNNLYPGNSVYSPASAHFFGDQPRRVDILKSLSEEKIPDFSRGFSDRPQFFRSKELLGTGTFNGWGAHCSVGGSDPSFKKDTCAEGLKCKSFFITKLENDSGICVSSNGPEIGEPLEVGMIETIDFGRDRLISIEKIEIPNALKDIYTASPQSGGFSGGNLRSNTCENLPPYASCGSLPAATPGFNPCLVNNSFLTCINRHASPVGLRACDNKNTCRDDYICVKNLNSTSGVCAPPYFLFQFRVDGHPKI